MIASDSTLTVEPFPAQTTTNPEGAGGEVSVSLPTELEQGKAHLAAAAEALGELMGLDDFVRLAWEAYVDSRPGLRDHLATAQLLAQIRDLREQGKVGQA